MNASKSRQVLFHMTKRYFWPLLYFKGFYQSERFFADMADDIRKAFTFNPRLSNRKTKEMSEQIDHDENAVSIHVRRGDYLEPQILENQPAVYANCLITSTP